MAGITLTERVVELTGRLVAVPSHETESAVQGLLAEILVASGFECELQEVAPHRPNLIAIRGEGGPLLCSHADTHPPHEHPDAHTVAVEDGRLVGRGVLDAKGQVAALVAAVEAVPEAPVVVAITCDEETGGLGSEHIHLPPHVTATGGLVLEPTDLRIGTAQGGCIDLLLEASGRPAHAYASQSAISAIDVVLGAVEALEDCSFLKARHDLLPPPPRHLGRLVGGEHLWRVPAAAHAELALGLVPGVDPEKARRETEEILEALAAGWRGRGATLRHEILDVCEPIEIPTDVPAVARLASVLDSTEPVGIPSWTDAANLLIHHGVACAIFGAGDLGSAHSNHETVAIADLADLAAVLVRFLEAD